MYANQGDHRSGRAAHLPQADGRVARARGRDGLHQTARGENRPVREAARGAHSRQAAVLRERRCRSAAANDQSLLVESHDGRPTKVEGNPLHPGSLGATDVFAQAAILGLYDPDRSQTLTNLGEIRPWSSFLGAINAALTAQKPLEGAGLRILTESINSPTLAAQIRELLKRFPAAKWHQWDPASRDNVRVGSAFAFTGEYVDAQYRFEQADVILSLDADFLGSGPGSLRYAREFAARRRPENANRMNRLYAVESMPASTGSRADHRLPARPSEIGAIARAIAAASGTPGPTGSGLQASQQKFAAAVAKDLLGNRGRSLVIAGDNQPPAVHVIAHAMNQALGNVGKTVVYTQTAEAEPVSQARIALAITVRPT